MAIHFPRLIHAKKIIRRSLMSASHTDSSAFNVPKGYLAVYVGEGEKWRFAIPILYLDHPSFQELLSQAEEEFGFDHPIGGLTISCREEIFIDLMSHLSRS